MDVIARTDLSFGKADDLAVFPDRRAVGEGLDRHLVSGWNIARDGQRNPADQFSARAKRSLQDRNVIGVAQSEGDLFELYLFGHVDG
jgi:hypothetical protein